jgi:predicted outer membrane repeat protein
VSDTDDSGQTSTEGDTCDVPSWCPDDDGDGSPDNTDADVCLCDDPGSGYAEGESDCDDSDDTAYPGADEICDQADNDCDGTVDEDDAIDATVWYDDDDGDGYGDPGDSRPACVLPLGYVADNTDCDDTSQDNYPDATEFCDQADNDCDGTVDEDDAVDATVFYEDLDFDGFGTPESTLRRCMRPGGYAENDADCDDTTAASNPDADEVCDESDNDCDGDIDEDAADASAWHGDGDGDGYGDPLDAVLACTQPSGYLRDSSDCNDAVSAINPAASEVCDGLDNDCDGKQDDETASDASDWYYDNDGDGYGTPSLSMTTCAQPSGWVADNTDCDDTTAGTSPGADEVCDGGDNDCDGAVDEDDAVDATGWYTDSDSDGFGDPDTVSVSCEASSGMIAESGDCDDGDEDINPDVIEVCDDLDNDCDGDTDEGDAADATLWYRDRDADDFGDPDTSTTACTEPDGYADNDADCDDTTASSTTSVWYRDLDDDGYGDAEDATYSCEQPAGYVSDDTDSDDSEGSIYPDADEVCGDGLDNDDDGLTDEGDAIDATIWFDDDDGDGFGDPDDSTRACEAPSDHVSNDNDCDDSDGESYPEATEYCDDVDNDCDGSIDENATDASTFFEDEDGDGYGDPADTVTACAISTGISRDSSDCDDRDSRVYPGAIELCDGQANDCDTTSSWTTSSEDGVISFENLNGAWTDLTVGYTWDDPSTPQAYSFTDAGTMWVCDGTYYATISTSVTHSEIIGRNGQDLTWLSSNLTGSFLTGVGTVYIDGVTIAESGGQAYGGAIKYNDTGGLEVVDSSFIDNYATSSGGAVYVNKGTVRLTRATFVDNVATYYGGDLYLYNAEVLLEDSSLSGGSVGNYGGSIYAVTTDMQVENTAIVSSYAGLIGGGIYYYGGELYLNDGATISGNATKGSGGAVYTRDADILYIGDVDISNNVVSSTSMGGGVCAERTDVLLDGEATFSGNSAAYGGALYVLSAAVEMSGVADFGSNAATDGGALYFDNVTATVENASFDDNDALSEGGAVYLSDSDVIFSNNTVTQNNAAWYGSGIYMVGSTLSALTSDWGTTTGGDDNIASDDVFVGDTSTSYTYGDSETFDCDTAGCD